jgi:hypothetical protein
MVYGVATVKFHPKRELDSEYTRVTAMLMVGGPVVKIAPEPSIKLDDKKVERGLTA